jgi:hypothetical protein
MNTKYNIIFAIITYFSCSHGLPKTCHSITKNGTIHTNILKDNFENPVPESVALVIYENNINETGYQLIILFSLFEYFFQRVYLSIK